MQGGHGYLEDYADTLVGHGAFDAVFDERVAGEMNAWGIVRL
jgi:hypothetical protein